LRMDSNTEFGLRTTDWKRRNGFLLNVIISDRINRTEGPPADGGALRLRLEAKRAESSKLKG